MEGLFNVLLYLLKKVLKVLLILWLRKRLMWWLLVLFIWMEIVFRFVVVLKVVRFMLFGGVVGGDVGGR